MGLAGWDTAGVASASLNQGANAQSAAVTDRGLGTNAPTVSVIISFLDSEKFIEESIQSVFNQTFEEWEILLVDDGSTDRSTEIARGLSAKDPHRIRYFEHQDHRNRGLPPSRNVGANNARGKYLAILDADDVWRPGKLQEQVELMESHPEVALVCGLSQYWYSWTTRAEDAGRDFVETPVVATNRLYQPPSLAAVRLNFEWPPPPSDLMVTCKALRGVGGFEESFAGMYAMYEDQALLTKLALKAPVFVAGRCWTRYRRHDNSICEVQTKAGNEPAIRKFYLEWLEEYLLNSGVEDREVWRGFRRARWLFRHRKLLRAAELIHWIPGAIARRLA